MAIYHLSAKVFSRGKGQSAIAAAAYRSGKELRDEQTGELKSYQARAGRVLITALMVPKDAPAWAHHRNHLWNEAERAEKRKDGQLVREFEVSLPHELTPQQREWLVKDFAREAFVRRSYAVDIAIHEPDRGDPRNHHAHLLITMRTLGPDGFATTKDRSLNGRDQLDQWREQWANLANRHLQRHGHEARIDHRSLTAQGIEREATTHVGYAGQEIDARGGESERMGALRDVLARNGVRAELAATELELAQLRELAVNENWRPAAMMPQSTRERADAYIRLCRNPAGDLKAWLRETERTPSLHAGIGKENHVATDDRNPHPGPDIVPENTLSNLRGGLDADREEGLGFDRLPAEPRAGAVRHHGLRPVRADERGQIAIEPGATQSASPDDGTLRSRPGRARESRAMQEPPTEEELRKQPEREREYLQHFQQRHERARAMLDEQQRARDLDDRAKAYQREKEQEADEARKKKEREGGEERREGRNGDISSAAARYSIAVGENYDVRDPYASLARAAGAESAMFHKNQEKLKEEAAKEQDPDKRRIIELRRTIEGCDYMAITNERLARISETVTGRSNNEYAVADRAAAAEYQKMAATLREERGALMENVQAKDAARDQLAQRVNDIAYADLRARQAAKSATGQDRPDPSVQRDPATRAAPEQAKAPTAPDRSATATRPAPAQPERAKAPATPDRSVATVQPAQAQTPVAPERIAKPAEPQPTAIPHTRFGTSMPFAAHAPYRTILVNQTPQMTTAAERGQAKPDIGRDEKQAAPPVNTREPTTASRRDHSLLKAAHANANAAGVNGPAIMVEDGQGKQPQRLDAFVKENSLAPTRPPQIMRPSDWRTNPAGRAEFIRARAKAFDTQERADKAMERIAGDLGKGNKVQAEDLRALTREQTDRIQAKGDAGLRAMAKEAHDRSHAAQNTGGRTRRDP